MRSRSLNSGSPIFIPRALTSQLCGMTHWSLSNGLHFRRDLSPLGQNVRLRTGEGSCPSELPRACRIQSENRRSPACQESPSHLRGSSHPLVVPAAIGRATRVSGCALSNQRHFDCSVESLALHCLRSNGVYWAFDGTRFNKVIDRADQVF